MPGSAHTWSPLSPAGVGTLFADAAFDWWLAGGFALELFVGRPWRDHQDIDVLVLRPQLPAVFAHLEHWDIWLADPPGELRPRRSGETSTRAHDIWLRQHAQMPWQLQLMVDEADGDTWHSRRNGALRLHKSAIGWRHHDGLPCLAPEVQLFYKAKTPRAKDEQDFAVVAPLLDRAQTLWLRDAIAQSHGPGHPWLAPLGGQLERSKENPA